MVECQTPDLKATGSSPVGVIVYFFFWALVSEAQGEASELSERLESSVAQLVAR